MNAFLIVLSIFQFFVFVFLNFMHRKLYKECCEIIDKFCEAIDLNERLLRTNKEVIDFNKRLIEELKQNDHGE